jgi:hypothetical protein
MADEVLQQGVRGITDLMVMPGLINLDFADVRSVMGEMGKAMMGTGEASGDNRAIEAAEQAIANPLLDGVSMQGAKGVIISITGGEDMRLMEVDEAANHIRELVDPTPTSSGVRRSTTIWKARSACRSSPPDRGRRVQHAGAGQGVLLPQYTHGRRADDAPVRAGPDRAGCGAGRPVRGEAATGERSRAPTGRGAGDAARPHGVGSCHGRAAECV